jgi:hypothetical protein
MPDKLVAEGAFLASKSVVSTSISVECCFDTITQASAVTLHVVISHRSANELNDVFGITT